MVAVKGVKGAKRESWIESGQKMNENFKRNQKLFHDTLK